MNPLDDDKKKKRSKPTLQRVLEGILDRLREGMEEIAQGLNPSRPQPQPIPIPVNRRRR
jgi:hypothetical protein